MSKSEYLAIDWICQNYNIDISSGQLSRGNRNPDFILKSQDLSFEVKTISFSNKVSGYICFPEHQFIEIKEKYPNCLILVYWTKSKKVIPYKIIPMNMLSYDSLIYEDIIVKIIKDKALV